MSESKHTPGPWAFRERAPPRKIALTRKHWEVGQVSLPNFGCAIVFGDTEANARLIAACPDLLEALQKINDWLVCAAIATDEDMAQSFPHMLQIATAAIAKAT